MPCDTMFLYIYVISVAVINHFGFICISALCCLWCLLPYILCGNEVGCLGIQANALCTVEQHTVKKT